MGIEEDFRDKEKKPKKKKKPPKKKFLFLIIVILASILALVVIFGFKTKSVTYEGNVHISNERLTQSIFGDKLPNSLIFKFFGRKNKSIPYVESFDVTIEKPSVLRIKVHEKQIVGYVEYMGNNVYIDNYGKVVDSTSEVFNDIPKLEGLEFETMIIDEIPKANNQANYENIITYATAYHKNGIQGGSISVDENGNTTIKVGGVLAACGNAENAERKVARLNRLLPQMKDLKGTLHLEDFDGSQTDIYFTKSEG